MTVHTGSDPRLLTQAAADVAQLTQPIHIAIRQGIRWRVETHASLLEQLADAAHPGSTARGPERHRPPGSRPAANLHALGVHDQLVVEMATWRRITPTRPATHDRGTTAWFAETLHAFIGVAPDLAPSLTEALGRDIHAWWRLAAATSGWRPSDLERLR